MSKINLIKMLQFFTILMGFVAFVGCVIVLAGLEWFLLVELDQKPAKAASSYLQEVHQERISIVSKDVRLEALPGLHTVVKDPTEVLPGIYKVTFEKAPDIEGAEAFPYSGFTNITDIQLGEQVVVVRMTYTQSFDGSEQSPFWIMKKQ